MKKLFAVLLGLTLGSEAALAQWFGPLWWPTEYVQSLQNAQNAEELRALLELSPSDDLTVSNLTVGDSITLGGVARGNWPLAGSGVTYEFEPTQFATTPENTVALLSGLTVTNLVAVGSLTLSDAAAWRTALGVDASLAAGTTAQYLRGDKSWQTLDKAAVGLPNVENTALSTWAGSANITTLGTIGTGTWQGTAIAVARGGTGATTAGGARTALELGNVENTALSTWAGSANITTLGTITSGTWGGDTLSIEKGGTGATSAEAARTALGISGVSGITHLTLADLPAASSTLEHVYVTDAGREGVFSWQSGFPSWSDARIRISGITVAGNVATVTTRIQHGWGIGESVTISGATPSALNAAHTITTVPDAYSFTFDITLADQSATGFAIWSLGPNRTIPGMIEAGPTGYWVRRWEGPVNPMWLPVTQGTTVTAAVASTNSLWINRALTLSKRSSPQHVYPVKLPVGRFRIVESIRPNTFCQFSGSGVYGTELAKHSDDGVAALDLGGISYGVIENLWIWGGGVTLLNTPAITLTTVNSSGFGQSALRDIRVWQHGTGLDINLAGVIDGYFNTFERIQINSGVRGIHVRKASSFNNNWFRDILIGTLTGEGILLDGGSTGFFTGLSVEQCRAGAIVVNSGTQWVFNNFWFEHQSSGAVYPAIDINAGSVIFGPGIAGASVSVDVAPGALLIDTAERSWTRQGQSLGYPSDGIIWPRGGDRFAAYDAVGTAYMPSATYLTNIVKSGYAYGARYYVPEAAGSSSTPWHVVPGTSTTLGTWNMYTNWTAIIGYRTAGTRTSFRPFSSGFATTGSLNRVDYTSNTTWDGVGGIYGSLYGTDNYVTNATYSIVGGVITVTTGEPHVFEAGNLVGIHGGASGTFANTVRALTVLTVPDTTTYTATLALPDDSGALTGWSYRRYNGINAFQHRGDENLRDDNSIRWIALVHDVDLREWRSHGIDSCIRISGFTWDSLKGKSNLGVVSLPDIRGNREGGGSGDLDFTIMYYGLWDRALSAGEVRQVMLRHQSTWPPFKGTMPDTQFINNSDQTLWVTAPTTTVFTNLTADRAITTQTVGMIPGKTFYVYNKASAYNLVVDTSLHTIKPGMWARLEYDGTAWRVAGAGWNDIASITVGNLTVSTNLILPNLPITDPGSLGALWRDGTNVFISIGTP